MVYQGRRQSRGFRGGHRPDRDGRDCGSHRRVEVWISAKDHVSQRKSDLSRRRPERGDTSVRLHRRNRTMALATAALLAATLAYAQAPAPTAAKVKAAPAAGKIRRTPDGHPDLSGNWTFGID